MVCAARAHARIRRAIIDRDVLIPRGAVIGFNPDEDRKRHTVTDLGVVVVTEDEVSATEEGGELVLLEGGTSVAELAGALNALGVTPRDIGVST